MEVEAIPSAQLAHVLFDAANAPGLPNVLYINQGALREERDRLFSKTWVGLGFAADIPTAGDALPVNWLGLPLLMVRDDAGVVRVFHNVCSHRGRQLVDAPCRIRGSLRCPYHAWTYGLDGALRGTPHFGGVNRHTTPTFDRTQHGLQEVPSAVWLDTVFVNVAGNAPAFETFIAPVRQRWRSLLGEHAEQWLQPGGHDSRCALQVRCNWKLAVENYCESYHLPFVHKALNSYSRLEDHYDILESDNTPYSGQGTRAYTLNDVADIRLPTLPSWSAARLREAEYLSLYPNVLLGLQADHAFIVLLEPTAVDTTTEQLRLLFVGEAARSAQHAPARRQILAAWEQVFGEDVAMVEGMQRGRHSPAYDGGVFSPAMDRTTQHFHRWVARTLLREDANAALAVIA